METPSSIALVDEFRRQLERAAQLAEMRRVPARPYISPELKEYSRLPTEKQIEILEYLKCFCDTTAEGKTRIETVRSLYSRREWEIPEDLFLILKEDMEIEFYNFDNQQIFRNIEFFRLSGRTIEEMCTIPWYDLYERDHAITDYMMELTVRLGDGEITGCMSYLTNTHQVRDANSRLRAGTEMGPLFAGPIKDKQGHLIGYFSTFRSP